MELHKQQVARGVARFLAAYPAKRREVESLDAELAECIGQTMEELRQQRSYELLAGTAKELGRDEFEFLLEFVYEDNLNHLQWLDTVPDSLRKFVPATIAAWDAQSDANNKWSDLGWDERDALVRAQRIKAAGS